MKSFLNRKTIISLMIVFAMAMAMVALSATVSHAASGTYWLKINKQRNVITAYKKVSGKWKPIRAMLCTTGAASTPTPSGTFYGGYKARWLHMVDEHGGSTYEQYTMLVNSSTQIYIHSVWYYSPKHSAQSSKEFNKLGSRGSHGCIRTSTMDAKWIYDHCKVGTKITIYSSKKSGALGKPKALHSSSGWDPTDPVKGNPHFNMRKPVITISKSKATTVQYGKSYSLKSKVSVKDPNALQNITSRLKVSSVYKWNSSSKKWVKSSFSTKKLGTYKIVYYVNDPYSTKASKAFKVKVVDTAAPTISVAANTASRKVTLGGTDAVNAISGITAKQATGSRTSAIQTTITAPDKTVTKDLTYAEAKAFTFDQVGRYKITYSVANKYNAKAVSTKSIYVYCQSTVPTLTGMTYTDAVAAAKTAGFTVTKVEEYSATVASGIVISQDVTAGTKSYKTITLTVSKGTDPAGTGA